MVEQRRQEGWRRKNKRKLSRADRDGDWRSAAGSQRPAHVGHLLALFAFDKENLPHAHTQPEKMRRKCEIKRQQREEVYAGDKLPGGEEQGLADAPWGERPRLTPQQRYGS